jgi:hypothetical protein
MIWMSYISAGANTLGAHGKADTLADKLADINWSSCQLNCINQHYI